MTFVYLKPAAETSKRLAYAMCHLLEEIPCQVVELSHPSKSLYNISRLETYPTDLNDR